MAQCSSVVCEVDSMEMGVLLLRCMILGLTSINMALFVLFYKQKWTYQVARNLVSTNATTWPKHLVRGTVFLKYIMVRCWNA